MTQETFIALGVLFTGLLVIALLAIGIGTLVMSLKEWLQARRWGMKRMLETQKALMEVTNMLSERLTAIEDELRDDAE